MDAVDIVFTLILVVISSFYVFMRSKIGHRMLFGDEVPKKDTKSDESYFTEEERAYLKELVKEKRTKTNL
ncbi:hypothetical protein Barb7_00656 [Bacteroidales bacterium Barb7]|nr:hypothetical protein Barb7_00656 [Bacteroidales bacterium Barb7]